MDEADIVTSIAMLLQPKYKLDMSPAEHDDWDDARDGSVACAKIASVFKKDEEALFVLLGAIRGGDGGDGIKSIVKVLKDREKVVINRKVIKNINISNIKMRLSELCGTELEDYEIIGENDDEEEEEDNLNDDAISDSTAGDDESSERKEETLQLLIIALNDLTLKRLKEEEKEISYDRKDRFHYQDDIYSFDREFLRWFAQVCGAGNMGRDFIMLDKMCCEILIEKMDEEFEQKIKENDDQQLNNQLKEYYTEIPNTSLNEFLKELKKDVHKYRLTGKMGYRLRKKIGFYNSLQTSIHFNMYNIALLLSIAAIDDKAMKLLYSRFWYRRWIFCRG